MRILHVTTFLQGGAGRIIAALAVAQRRAGHDVAVVADAGTYAEYQTYPEYLAQLAAAGVVYLPVTSTFLRDPDLNVAAAQRLRHLARTECPDIVHAHAAVPASIARVALSGIPVVQTMHGWGVRKSASQAADDVAVMNEVDVLVTPSHAARAQITAHGVDRHVDVIPYGIAAAVDAGIEADDERLFDGLRRRRTAVMMCIGTIGARKNQALIVDAMRGVDVDVVFIGDGNADRLKSHAAAAGLQDRVHVLGYRANASRYLRHADAMVLPSRNEGLPIAVLEAFRAGIPVIASQLPEFEEAIEHRGTGLLFAAQSASSLRDAISELSAMTVDARQGLAASAMRVYTSRFAQDRMIADYACVYDRVIAASRTCSVAHQHVS